MEEDQDTHSTKEFINSEKSALSSNDLSGDSFQREFELDDVYPYIKTGIASIIEDEVTQRFVAEELKVSSIMIIRQLHPIQHNRPLIQLYCF